VVSRLSFQALRAARPWPASGKPLRTEDAALVLTGEIRLWQVVVLALLFGVLSAVDNPARMAFVQEVVGRDMVRNAVSLNTTLVNVARVAGPTVAAVLVAQTMIGFPFADGRRLPLNGITP
jgi:MFS family permease